MDLGSSAEEGASSNVLKSEYDPFSFEFFPQGVMMCLTVGKSKIGGFFLGVWRGEEAKDGSPLEHSSSRYLLGARVGDLRHGEMLP